MSALYLACKLMKYPEKIPKCLKVCNLYSEEQLFNFA